jgi:DNA-binding response OmpR family regulator
MTCLEESDGVVCLELGANDFIIKPFSLRELLARVRAILWQQEVGASRNPATRNEVDTNSLAGSLNAAAENLSIPGEHRPR